MQATIKRINIQNFKGIKEKEIIFNSQNAKISGQNASGKSSIVDAVTWALFGVDSQWNAKFEIRPLDENGEKIHNIEISVCVVFEIDGKEKSFQRQLKENWVTKRGTSERTLQGNVGAYSVDDYPKSEKEYKECVAGIVGEDLFKILTSPTYFPNMKWQEQREILMRFVTDISDVELAGQDKRFSDLISELEKAPSTDDIKKKYQKALTEWKKKQAELPVRIDEAEKQKVDIDVAELELLKNALNEQITENKEKQEDISKVAEEQDKASDGILELKFELNDLQRKANEDLEKKRRELRNEESDLCHRADRERSDIGYKKTQIHNCELHIKDLTADLEKAREEYTAKEKMEFDESDLTCKICGQSYPAEKAVEIRMDFHNRKNNILSEVAVRGNSIKEELQKEKDILENSKKELETLEKGLSEKMERIEKVREKMRELPDSIDISNRPEVQEIQRQIAEKEAAMNNGNGAEEIRQKLKDECEDLQSQLTEVEKQIALAQKNVEIDDRIAELREEQRKTAQCVANQEKMLFLLEEFIRHKINMISDTINSKFDGVCFRLFTEQINGGTKETCECTVDGVPYGSLNSGHKIIAGLKIISALQQHYDCYLSVFIDNAESVNSFNIPKMDCQMITLAVSDDKELKIEMEG